jgi:hypothetical protein
MLEHRYNRWYNYGALGKGLTIFELAPPIFCYGGTAIGPAGNHVETIIHEATMGKTG